jgi:hypothetical protein
MSGLARRRPVLPTESRVQKSAAARARRKLGALVAELDGLLDDLQAAGYPHGLDVSGTDFTVSAGAGQAVVQVTLYRRPAPRRNGRRTLPF